ncbi:MULTISPECIES: lipoprotein signal peptidase [unclassified Prevotella]|uniref:lipoprotein signal peptidase n=1 Tax=unclassified Prevotella TaxID=2638335 RepID=UPI000D0C122F|nr:MULTISPECIES: lipoprotein signal peptidase [unclassified Prevotella]GAY28626.1 signal peptidase II [Prevotella sp. MGM1]
MSIKDVFTRGRMAMLIVIAILLIDQIIKIWVKTNMTLHEVISVTSWFKICFIENNGMAYGMEIGSKLLLSLFRIVAISVGVYYLYLQTIRRAKFGYIACLALVIAGAVGNVIDCMFYGLIFNASSEYYTSFVVPFGTGYAPFLMGKVVDMFYFPLIVTTWPEWIPVYGGSEFIFFSPIFNFADASISVGVVLLLLFYRKELSEITLRK